MNYSNLLLFFTEGVSFGAILEAILNIIVLIIHALLPLGIIILVTKLMSYADETKYSEVPGQTRPRIIICGIIRIVALAFAAMSFQKTYTISLGALFGDYFTFGGMFSSPVHNVLNTVHKFVHSYPALHFNDVEDGGQYVVGVIVGIIIVVVQYFLVTRISGLRSLLNDSDDYHNATVERTFHDEIEIVQQPTYSSSETSYKVVVNQVEDTSYSNWRVTVFVWIIGMFVFPVAFIISQIVLTIKEIIRCG